MTSASAVWVKASLIVATALLTGIAIGAAITGKLSFWPENNTVDTLYSTTDQALMARMSPELKNLGWKALLPPDEAAVIERYQPDESKPMADQVFQSIRASFDNQYQSVQTSINTVQSLDQTPVAIHGFIVPLDVSEKREILSFFLVPYFGACIHFPPPAPNQMVYVRTPGGFKVNGSSEAYTVTGLLQVAMFEDPMGTSAYLMDAITITSFSGQPDDVRNHNVQTY